MLFADFLTAYLVFVMILITVVCVFRDPPNTEKLCILIYFTHFFIPSSDFFCIRLYLKERKE